MFSLSKESEQDLTQGVLELVGNYLEVREQTQPRLLGLITAQQIKDELGIKAKTLKRWEDNGLRRYQPPLEDTRKHYYKVSDILIFWGWIRKWLFMKQEVLVLISTPTKDS
ncbi:TPA: XRE family transcriptional regulator [Streptococcus agalactiae]